MTFWVGPPYGSHTLVKFGGHRHRGSGDVTLVCHAISLDHVS